MSGINIGLHELKIFEAYELLRAIAGGPAARPDFAEALAIERTVDAIMRSADAGGGWVDVA